MEITKQALLTEALIKAFIHAIIIPIIAGFTLAVLYAPSVAFYSILAWYLIVGFGYYVSETKQLTAMVYFKIMKYLITPVALMYLALIVMSWGIAKFL
ncbi:MAG: hypothetical protein RBR26_07385 [Methanosarcina mazei]|nr:hypothetical protein [Methanosarcina mazei]